MNDIILLLGSDGAGGKLYGNKLCKKCIQNLFILGSMFFSWGYHIHPCGCYSGRKFYRQYRPGCGEHCNTGISALFTYGNHLRRRCRRLNWEKTRRSRSERCKSGFRLRIKCRTDNRCAFRSCISRISQRIMQSAWCHTGAFATGTAVSERGVCLCPDLCVI